MNAEKQLTGQQGLEKPMDLSRVRNVVLLEDLTPAQIEAAKALVAKNSGSAEMIFHIGGAKHLVGEHGKGNREFFEELEATDLPAYLAGTSSAEYESYVQRVRSHVAGHNGLIFYAVEDKNKLIELSAVSVMQPKGYVVVTPTLSGGDPTPFLGEFGASGEAVLYSGDRIGLSDKSWGRFFQKLDELGVRKVRLSGEQADYARDGDGTIEWRGMACLYYAWEKCAKHFRKENVELMDHLSFPGKREKRG